MSVDRPRAGHHSSRHFAANSLSVILGRSSGSSPGIAAMMLSASALYVAYRSSRSFRAAVLEDAEPLRSSIEWSGRTSLTRMSQRPFTCLMLASAFFAPLQGNTVYRTARDLARKSKIKNRKWEWCRNPDLNRGP